MAPEMILCASNQALQNLAAYLTVPRNIDNIVNDPIILEAFRRHGIVTNTNDKDVMLKNIRDKIVKRDGLNIEGLYRIACAIKDCNVRGLFYPEHANETPDKRNYIHSISMSKTRAQLCLLASYFVENYPETHVSIKRRCDFMNFDIAAKGIHYDNIDEMPVVSFNQQNNYLGFLGYNKKPMAFNKALQIESAQHYIMMIDAQLKIAKHALKDDKNRTYNLILPHSSTWGCGLSSMEIFNQTQKLLREKEYKDLKINVMIYQKFDNPSSDFKNMLKLNEFKSWNPVSHKNEDRYLIPLSADKKQQFGFYNVSSTNKFPSSNDDEMWCFANAGDPFTVPGNEGFQNVYDYNSTVNSSTDCGMAKTDIWKYRVPPENRDECKFINGIYKLPCGTKPVSKDNSLLKRARNILTFNMPQKFSFIDLDGSIKEIVTPDATQTPFLEHINEISKLALENKVQKKTLDKWMKGTIAVENVFDEPEKTTSKTEENPENNISKPADKKAEKIKEIKKPIVDPEGNKPRPLKEIENTENETRTKFNNPLNNKIELPKTNDTNFNTIENRLPINIDTSETEMPQLLPTQIINAKLKPPKTTNTTTTGGSRKETSNKIQSNNNSMPPTTDTKTPPTTNPPTQKQNKETKSYIPSAIGGVVGATGITVGTLSVSGVINLSKSLGIGVLAVGGASMLTSFIYGVYCYNNNKQVSNGNQTQFSLQNVNTSNKNNAIKLN